MLLHFPLTNLKLLSSFFLQPTPLHLTVKEYVTPEKFAFWKDYGESIGFRYVASGPLVNFYACIVIFIEEFRKFNNIKYYSFLDS